MALKNLLLILALMMMVTCLMADIATATSRNIKPGYNLAARLEASSGGGLLECWNALMELKSCTNEILTFFLNGQADIGHNCCHAIDIITRSCWPEMLSSIGFTAEEGNVLRGYCDAAASSAPSPGGPEGIYQHQASMVLA